MSLAARLADVRARLDAACDAAGRDRSSVTLVGVSKTHPVPRLQEALAEGLVDLGENYAQSLRDKAAALDGVRWHFIGAIQRNKAKYIAPVAHRIHTVDRVSVAEALVARAPNGVDGLVPVNIGREDSKSGVDPDAVVDTVRALSQVEGLRLHGLMCLPPWSEDPEQTAPFFEATADLLDRCRADGHAFTELSMGMSGDFEVAVRYGATHVRVGTAIFGPRVR
jgi:pyridoxal phosphate enzyme (YggS family)